MLPQLTIGIPTLNRALMVSKLVEKCLSQTVLPFEVIVSDDASDDDTLLRLRDIRHSRLRIIEQNPRLGMISNWNACLDACRSDWFMILSDDDIITADFVSCFSETLTIAPEAEFLLMRGRIVDRLTGETNKNYPPLKKIGYVDFTRNILPSWLNYQFAIPFASMIFKTETLRAFGGFTTAFPYAADVATGFPIAIRRKCAFYPEEKVDCTVHEGMATLSYSAQALIDDVINLTEFVVAQVSDVHADEPQLIDDIAKSSRVYLRKMFGHVMITSARRGVTKWQLIKAWAIYSSRLPGLGLGPMSIGAVLVPQRLIQTVGWPYRKYVAWKLSRLAAR